jgi:hypothetical protein
MIIMTMYSSWDLRLSNDDGSVVANDLDDELISPLPRDTGQWCRRWRDLGRPPEIAWTESVLPEEVSSRSIVIVLRPVSRKTNRITALADRGLPLQGLPGQFSKRTLCLWMALPVRIGRNSVFLWEWSLWNDLEVSLWPGPLLLDSNDLNYQPTYLYFQLKFWFLCLLAVTPLAVIRYRPLVFSN